MRSECSLKPMLAVLSGLELERWLMRVLYLIMAESLCPSELNRVEVSSVARKMLEKIYFGFVR